MAGPRADDVVAAPVRGSGARWCALGGQPQEEALSLTSGLGVVSVDHYGRDEAGHDPLADLTQLTGAGFDLPGCDVLHRGDEPVGVELSLQVVVVQDQGQAVDVDAVEGGGGPSPGGGEDTESAVEQSGAVDGDDVLRALVARTLPSRVAAPTRSWCAATVRSMARTACSADPCRAHQRSQPVSRRRDLSIWKNSSASCSTLSPVWTLQAIGAWSPCCALTAAHRCCPSTSAYRPSPRADTSTIPSSAVSDSARIRRTRAGSRGRW